MWKRVGSVQSVDTKSERSHKRLSPDEEYECFRKKGTGSVTRNKDRSFSIDYIQKRQEKYPTISNSSHLKSQKSFNIDSSAKQDIFTSMRHILHKEIVLDSNLQSRKTVVQFEKQHVQDHKRGKFKAFPQVSKLKKEHSKLKQWINNQFTSFKNLMLQLENTVYQHNQTHKEVEETAEDHNLKINHELLSSIVCEARAVEAYFAAMDRKKDQILRRLDWHD